MTVEEYQRLKNAFPHVNFSGALDLTFHTLWKEKIFKRNEFITEAGQVEKSFYFVLEGVQMIYLINRKGEKVILGFSYTNSYSGVYDSFLKQNPSDFFLEAILPSRMLALSLEHYNALFEKYPEFEKWGRIIHSEILIGRVKREVELLTKSAEERYTVFMQRCPDILKTISQKYLASYLNMKPETFSRLRRTVKL